jgi:hypothetical protein
VGAPSAGKREDGGEEGVPFEGGEVVDEGKNVDGAQIVRGPNRDGRWGVLGYGDGGSDLVAVRIGFPPHGLSVTLARGDGDDFSVPGAVAGVNGVLHTFWPFFNLDAAVELSNGNFEKEGPWFLWSESFGGGNEPGCGDWDGAAGVFTEQASCEVGG